MKPIDERKVHFDSLITQINAEIIRYRTKILNANMQGKNNLALSILEEMNGSKGYTRFTDVQKRTNTQNAKEAEEVYTELAEIWTRYKGLINAVYSPVKETKRLN